jgi:hypothetical protein
VFTPTVAESTDADAADLYAETLAGADVHTEGLVTGVEW